jgi:hypothetical protein
LGGSGAESGQAIAVDSLGQTYVAGSTTSSNFPTILGAVQGTFVATGTNSTAFVAKVSRAEAAGVAITPQQLNFGNQALGITSNAQTMTLINAGSEALLISSIESGANFSVTDDCGTLVPPAGGHCAIQVTFTPTTLGGTTDQITINDSAAGSPHRVVVTGTGVASSAGALTLSPSSLSFAAQAVGVTSAPQVVRLSNTSLAAVTLTAISVSGDFSESNNCGSFPSVLNVGASCSIAVTFTPTATGNRTGSVSISANTGAQSVSLTGTGNPVFALSANPRSTVILIGTTTATFTVTATAPSSFTNSITLACGSGASCTFNPTSILAGQSSTLTVTGLSATTSSPLNVTVTGTAVSQTANVALTVFLSDFSVAVTPLLNTVSAGKSTTYTITVAPTNGFNQVVQLGVTGLPQATTATLSPPAVVVPGTGPATALVTLATTVQTSRLWWLFPDGPVHPGSPVSWHLPWVFFLAALALLAAMVAAGAGSHGTGPVRKRARAVLCVAALVFLAALQVSCSNYYYNPVTPAVTGTPYGVFTITITGTLGNNHAVSHTTTMNLSVGP